MVLILIAQFFGDERKRSNERTYDISTRYEIPQNVNHLVQVAYNDCHTNKTSHPWYANVQPVG
ncbi:heme-binding domain-containing protein [Salmonirosea aquatica]